MAQALRDVRAVVNIPISTRNGSGFWLVVAKYPSGDASSRQSQTNWITNEDVLESKTMSLSL
jgi:hypothetical protein